MSARSHTPGRSSAGPGARTRLPWWAVLLPAVAFAVLLVVVDGSGTARAESAGRPPAGIVQVLGHFLAALPSHGS
ncbi:hypothetical protein [Streptomyces sp. URMC 123]|uniref:hypothetical protein n=1 Tax=Streptomyces sp. URMC 123 TaxID=3423403 RepID=UPI003F1C00B2